MIVSLKKIDFFSTNSIEYDTTLHYLSKNIKHSKQYYFDVNVVTLNDNTGSETIIFSPDFLTHSDTTNINECLTFFDKYKNLIILVPEEDCHIDGIQLQIAPFLKQLNKNILWIGSQPDIHNILKLLDVNNAYEFPLDGLMYGFIREHFNNISLNENRQFLLKTYLNKSKWWRDAIYILQSIVIPNDSRCLLNYTGGGHEYNAMWYKNEMSYLFNQIGVDFDEIKFQIKAEKHIKESGYENNCYNLADTMFYILTETYNPSLFDTATIPPNEYLTLIDGTKLYKQQYIYSFTEKSIWPLVNGNIFYDFNFITNTSKFIKKYGFETFYEDHSFIGLHNFLLDIKENGDDIYYDKTNQTKIKHNFVLAKEIYNPNHNLLLKYIIDFTNGKLTKV